MKKTNDYWNNMINNNETLNSKFERKGEGLPYWARMSNKKIAEDFGFAPEPGMKRTKSEDLVGKLKQRNNMKKAA